MHGYVCFVLSAKSFPSIKSNITSSRACCTILFIHITQMKPAFLSLRATHVCFSKVRLRKDILHILEHRKSDISVPGSDGHSYSRQCHCWDLPDASQMSSVCSTFWPWPTRFVSANCLANVPPFLQMFGVLNRTQSTPNTAAYVA